jgi:hypothetical protein
MAAKSTKSASAAPALPAVIDEQAQADAARRAAEASDQRAAVMRLKQRARRASSYSAEDRAALIASARTANDAQESAARANRERIAGGLGTSKGAGSASPGKRGPWSI